jgi:hypothetical protein
MTAGSPPDDKVPRFNPSFIFSRHGCKRLIRIEEVTTMPVVMFRPAADRWIGPLALGCLIASLCFAPLSDASGPNASGWPSGKDAATVRHAEAAALRAIRDGFLRARLTESETRSGQSGTAHDMALSAVNVALDTMRDDSEIYGPLRTALDHYLAASRSVAALPDRPGEASTASIEAVLGQLQVRDEAALRDPLLRLRLSEAAVSSTGDAASAQSVSLVSADAFAGRLTAVSIPDGTRARLAMSLAVYEHAASATNNAAITLRLAEVALRNAANEVEVALADAGRVLMTMPKGQIAAIDTVSPCGWWMFGVVFAALLSLTAGAGIRKGRASAFDRSPIHRWALR